MWETRTQTQHHPTAARLIGSFFAVIALVLAPISAAQAEPATQTWETDLSGTAAPVADGSYPLEGDEIPLADQEKARGGGFFVVLFWQGAISIMACASKPACYRAVAAGGEFAGRQIISFQSNKAKARQVACRYFGKFC